MLFGDDNVVGVAAAQSTESAPDTIDLMDVVAEAQADLVRRRAAPRPNMFSTGGRAPRVRKIVKNRRGWTVDYVVPDSEPSESETGS